MELITEVENPILRRTYLVPCILKKTHSVYRWRFVNDITPILLPAHEDAKYLDVASVHYHYDFRFFSVDDYKEAKSYYPNLKNGHHGMVAHAKDFYKNIIYKELAYKRPMTEFPNLERFTKALEPAFKNKCLIDGHICPHKGIDLRGMPIVDGKVICPGHGLQFDTETGQMVARTDEQQTLTYRVR